MTKFVKKLTIVLVAVVVMALALAGCVESYKQNPVAGGDASAKVESNGGLAVKQGKYLYFINGLGAYADIKETSDNEFGKVVKGAIMRAEVGENGKIVENSTVTLVPKMALSSNKEAGIYVYGKWVYYTSPSIGTDKEGVVQTTYIDYMRTSIDGTVTQKIATVEGQSLEFKFTHNAFVYFKDNKITSIAYDDNKIGKETVIDEKVTDVLFPMNDAFDPATPDSIQDVFFYTKAAEDETATYNVLYSVKSDGSNKKTVIDNTSYDKDNNKQLFNIALKSYKFNGNKVQLYYEKTNYFNGASTNYGIYGYEFGEDMTFDKTKEVRFTNSTFSTIYPYDFEKGLMIMDGNTLRFMKERKTEGSPATYFDPAEDIEFSASVTVLGFGKAAFVTGYAEGKVIYESLDALFYINGSIVEARAIGNDKVSAIQVTSAKADTSWLNPEIIGNNVYFFNSDYYTYMERVSLIDKEDSEHMGKLNAADQKTEDKKKEEEEKKNNQK